MAFDVHDVCAQLLAAPNAALCLSPLLCLHAPHCVRQTRAAITEMNHEMEQHHEIVVQFLAKVMGVLSAIRDLEVCTAASRRWRRGEYGRGVGREGGVGERVCVWARIYMFCVFWSLLDFLSLCFASILRAPCPFSLFIRSPFV